MTKDVLLSIRGLHFEGAMDGEKIETITKGSFHQRNDDKYVIYEEVMEGFEEPVKSMIHFKEKELILTKKGIVNVNMVFEEKKKNMTNYKTPYGNILIGIDTDRVSVKEEENRIKIEVKYSLEVNYEHLADCKIDMEIIAKEEEQKRLGIV